MSGLNVASLPLINYLIEKVRVIGDSLAENNPEIKEPLNRIDKLMHVEPERMLMLIPEIINIKPGDPRRFLTSSNTDGSELSWYRPLLAVFANAQSADSTPTQRLMFADNALKLLFPTVTRRPCAVNSQGELILRDNNGTLDNTSAQWFASAKQAVIAVRNASKDSAKIREIITSALKKNWFSEGFTYLLILASTQAVHGQTGVDRCMCQEVCTALENILLSNHHDGPLT